MGFAVRGALDRGQPSLEFRILHPKPGETARHRRRYSHAQVSSGVGQDRTRFLQLTQGLLLGKPGFRQQPPGFDSPVEFFSQGVVAQRELIRRNAVFSSQRVPLRNVLQQFLGAGRARPAGRSQRCHQALVVVVQMIGTLQQGVLDEVQQFVGFFGCHTDPALAGGCIAVVVVLVAPVRGHRCRGVQQELPGPVQGRASGIRRGHGSE
mmetsp:Transcript_28090/g.60214  ORF Transcript_28090/g.60214 Transcript_28090/m.60214 type:complete len:208 (+) Transcript_28090:894-1517(+)